VAAAGLSALARQSPAEGSLGVARPEGNVPKRDQGLYLWAYDIALSDNRPNDGQPEPGASETATLEPVFQHRFESRFTPDLEDIQSYGQSYYECDGFYRNKAMLIDGQGILFAWEPPQRFPGSIHCRAARSPRPGRGPTSLRTPILG
jgi:hypothetical protein